MVIFHSYVKLPEGRFRKEFPIAIPVECSVLQCLIIYPKLIGFLHSNDHCEKFPPFIATPRLIYSENKICNNLPPYNPSVQ